MSELPDDDFAVETRVCEGGTVLKTLGDVTVFTSPALRQALREAATSKPERLVIDLSATPYIDSSGVATLVEALQLTAPFDGKVVLAGMSDRVRGVFEISRLINVFTTAPDVEEALTA